MDLKIRLPEGLDARLRTHAENTGATLNSIICLAVDAFVPGGVKAEKVDVKAPALEPVKVAKRVVLASKQQVLTPPNLSAKPTKDERRKLAAWHRANPSGQPDLLDKL